MFTAPIQVVIADATQLLIEPLAAQIDADSDIAVVGTATDSEGIFLKVAQSRPDVVVLDVDLPGRGSFEVARKFAATADALKLIFISSSPSDILIEQAMQVGARGFLLKTEPPSSLIKAIKSVQLGETCFSLQVGDRMDYDPIRKHYKLHSGGHLSMLTARQFEILRHLAQGRTVKEIARILDVSQKSIDSHKYRLMNKLDIHDRVELARYAFREGLAIP